MSLSSPRRPIVLVSLGLSLLAFIGAGAPAVGDPAPANPWAVDSSTTSPVRWTAAEIECPEGTARRHRTSGDGERVSVWCVRFGTGERVALHGPYVELFADGSTHRQGYYVSGKQSGRWITWDGEKPVRDVLLWPGEASWFLPQPEDVCPPGSERDRSYGHDHKRRMWSQCLRVDAEGNAVRVGPYITWDIEVVGGGNVLHLRELVEYVDGEADGRRLRFRGLATDERIVLDETWADGVPHGESRALFLDGSVRETRFYRHGLLDGERRAFYPDGNERWRAVYENGFPVSASGDLTVDGQPCPEHHLPELAASGLGDFCTRREGHRAIHHGAFTVRDADHRVIERGLYRHGEKVELWEAPPDTELPEPVGDDVLVAEGLLLVDGQPLTEVTAAAANVWTKDRKNGSFPGGRVEIDGSTVRLYGLQPGSYYAGIEVDADASNPPRFPGDLTGSYHFEIEADTVAELVIPLVWTLHLVEPIDNNQPQKVFTHPCDDALILSPAARFAWRVPGSGPTAMIDRPATGVEYTYRVHRVSCDPWQRLDVVAEGATTDLGIDLWLPPTAPGEVYSFTLGARAGDVGVGQLMSFGTDNSYGWDLRFRVDLEGREQVDPANW